MNKYLEKIASSRFVKEVMKNVRPNFVGMKTRFYYKRNRFDEPQTFSSDLEALKGRAKLLLKGKSIPPNPSSLKGKTLKQQEFHNIILKQRGNPDLKILDRVGQAKELRKYHNDILQRAKEERDKAQWFEDWRNGRLPVVDNIKPHDYW